MTLLGHILKAKVCKKITNFANMVHMPPPPFRLFNLGLRHELENHMQSFSGNFMDILVFQNYIIHNKNLPSAWLYFWLYIL